MTFPAAKVIFEVITEALELLKILKQVESALQAAEKEGIVLADICMNTEMQVSMPAPTF